MNAKDALASALVNLRGMSRAEAEGVADVALFVLAGELREGADEIVGVLERGWPHIDGDDAMKGVFAAADTLCLEVVAP
ncbi:hypothetical protein PBI_NESBITT_45 [Streptomyces phage Nesbitt]|uniref:Uncharacterized protein n=2 Tax=Abbeymikolonvirus abbeymikolon TaxID=2734213 RepID=A0A2P1JT77_9CAUD|nr:hypothetical protein HOS57_gp47 [Streptomyces phage AbbeyMikolon]AUG87118.1 hypothetical protein SEA_ABBEYMIKOLON_47 [Streptomyces phage AbbeyMikolon]AVO22302.1 hypothetical protein PBI_NESBITT_45 [Streptomyces phage Nesbitt]